MKGHDEPIRREVARHPGVAVHFEPRGKHHAAVLTYQGRSRFVILSGTPGDHRGILNKIRDVRHTIRDLLQGAGR